jgi:hypothetical protein
MVNGNNSWYIYSMNKRFVSGRNSFNIVDIAVVKSEYDD